MRSLRGGKCTISHAHCDSRSVAQPLLTNGSSVSAATNRRLETNCSTSIHAPFIQSASLSSGVMSKQGDNVVSKTPSPSPSNNVASGSAEPEKPDSPNKVVTFLAVDGAGQRPRIQRTSTPYSELIGMSSMEEDSDSSVSASPTDTEAIHNHVQPVTLTTSPLAKK
jgi:hypothetical protein